jgi:uncharacterized protein YdeI (YjbR/CyaY-like superfamily)
MYQEGTMSDLPDAPELEPELVAGRPVLHFETQPQWADWLAEHHASSPGVWLRLAKKAAALNSVSYAEALDISLCYGWIDGQKKGYDAESWLQKFTPRGPKSLWSKINREKIAALTAAGRMQPAGLLAVERAKQDGRWDAAYDSQRTATVPDDFQAELERNPAASAFFATLNSQNRYAILFRIQTAKTAATRAKRIEQFITMLESGEKIYL